MTKKKETGASAPKRPQSGWEAELFGAAKAVAATDKKMDFYHQARREAPEKLSAQLSEQERELDALVLRLLSERENLKAEVIEDGRFDDEALRELDFSYQKAVCFGPGKARARSRMFYLPCVYWTGEDGAISGLVDFKDHRASTFGDFVAAFLEERFGDEGSMAPTVSVYPTSLMDWNVQDDEEKMLPALHAAVLAGRELDVDAAFPYRAQALAQSQGKGWSVCVLPFAVQHDDEAWLESIAFEGFEEEFLEGFEEIFDPSSELDYDIPFDPTMLADQAVRLLWSKQLELIVAEMSAQKKARHIGVVESTFAWEGGDYAGVIMDFKLIDPDGDDDDDDDGENGDRVVYHRQMTRATLMGERPGDLSSMLAEYPSLMREDFDLVFGHQFDSADDASI